MSVTLGQQYPPDFAGRPPHMPGRELAIWSRFRANPPFRPAAWYFDVVCGTPAPPGEHTPHYSAEAWAFITSKRIDAVADLGDRWMLLEIRRGASLSAIGTLQGYLMCFRSEPPDDRPSEGLLVTDFLDPDAAALARASQISTLEVGR